MLDWFILGLVSVRSVFSQSPACRPMSLGRSGVPKKGKPSSMKIYPYCIEPVHEEASVCAHCTAMLIEEGV